MTQKEKRDRLFKSGRPLIRPLQIYDGEKYHKDIGILWVAYSKEPFYSFPEGLSKTEFVEVIKEMVSTREVMMIDDTNSEYRESGPVAMITVQTDGWKIEPHTSIFPWATTRNKLRGVVSFFQMVRYKKIGVCIIYSLQQSKSLFDKCIKYGVLHYVGKIVNGDPRGDEYIYSVRGKRNVG